MSSEKAKEALKREEEYLLEVQKAVEEQIALLKVVLSILISWDSPIIMDTLISHFISSRDLRRNKWFSRDRYSTTKGYQERIHVLSRILCNLCSQNS